MRKTMLVAAAALIGSVGVAAAADLGGYRGPSMKDEPLPAIYPTWGGFYVGGNVGYGWGNVKNDFTFGDTISDDPNGVIYGGQIGYNFQRGNIIFGLEASLNGTGMDDSKSVFIVDESGKLKNQIDWYATGVGRLGYASGSWLFYGFGGVAWGNVKTKLSTDSGDFSDSDSATHIGWTAGAGIERLISGNLSVRLEYSHVDLGSETVFKNDFDEDKVDASFDAVKLGVNYKLTGERELEPLK